jgi:hypothetical protein
MRWTMLLKGLILRSFTEPISFWAIPNINDYPLPAFRDGRGAP